MEHPTESPTEAQDPPAQFLEEEDDFEMALEELGDVRAAPSPAMEPAPSPARPMGDALNVASDRTLHGPLSRPGLLEPERSEHSAPFVCDFEDDSQYSGDDAEELSTQELYDRFDELWPTDRGAREALTEFSGSYIQSVVSALEDIAETCRTPSYEPYEAPKPQGVVLPVPKRVPTPPPIEPPDELPPPPVVSYRKKCIVPYAVKEQERMRERIRQGQIRAFGKAWSPPKSPDRAPEFPELDTATE